jgi:ADP-ribose pyrophosphatase
MPPRLHWSGGIFFDPMTTPDSGPSRWEKQESSLLARTRIFDLDQIRYRHPKRGAARDFVVIQPPDWVNVLALTSAHELVLVRQFRFGIDDFALEIPGGMIDAGESPLVAGARELLEETGYEGGEIKSLGTVRPNPAIQSNRCHIALATDVDLVGPTSWDTDEEIEVFLRPVDEVLQLARSGGITHSLVLNALFLFEPWWREMRARGV